MNHDVKNNKTKFSNKFKKGGKVIGSGSYGCVFKPGLTCKTNKKRHDNSEKC